MINPRSHLLQKCTKCRTAFLCCDIQEKLRNRIPNFNEAVIVSNKFTALAEVLTKERCTYVATEQYPQGVGHLVKEIRLPEGTPIFPKTQTSMLTEDVLPYILGDKSRGLEPVQQVVLWGHETQVCIMQTADDLLSRDIRVAIALDGCGAQTKLDHDAAVMTMASWKGLVLSTTVSIYTQLTQGDPSLSNKSLLKVFKAGDRIPTAP